MFLPVDAFWLLDYTGVNVIKLFFFVTDDHVKEAVPGKPFLLV